MNSRKQYDGRENVFRITEWFSVCLNFIAKLCDLMTVATETSELFRNTLLFSENININSRMCLT